MTPNIQDVLDTIHHLIDADTWEMHKPHNFDETVRLIEVRSDLIRAANKLTKVLERRG